MGERTFKPFDDDTVSMVVSSSSDRVAFSTDHNGATARLCNVGADWIFVRFGDSTVEADDNDIPIPPNWVEVFALPNGVTHCAAASNSSPGSNTLYITPGEGD